MQRLKRRETLIAQVAAMGFTTAQAKAAARNVDVAHENGTALALVHCCLQWHLFAAAENAVLWLLENADAADEEASAAGAGAGAGAGRAAASDEKKASAAESKSASKPAASAGAGAGAAAKAASSTSFEDAIMAMGFSREDAKLASAASGSNVHSAVLWLVERKNKREESALFTSCISCLCCFDWLVVSSRRAARQRQEARRICKRLPAYLFSHLCVCSETQAVGRQAYGS
jgi:hypothetical protein